jgi:hypothetical protein
LSHLETPFKENITKSYATRANSQGIVDSFPELEIYCKRRRCRHKTRELNNQLGIESVKDMIRLFFDNSSFMTQIQMSSPWLTNFYKQFDFTNIAG